MAHTHLKMQLERLWLDWPTIAVLTAFVVIGIADIANPGMFDDAVTVATGGGFLFAGVRLLRYGRKDSHPDRRGFGLIGVTLLLGALGMVLFGVVSQFAPLPAFGPLDGIFIAMYLTALTGLALMPSVTRGWRSRVRIIVDGVAGAVSIGVLTWHLVGTDIVSGLSSLSTPQRLIGLTYPVLDVALVIGVMVLLLRQDRYRFDVRLVALSIAFAFQAAADLSYVTSVTTGLFVDTDSNLLLFMASAASFVVVAGLVERVSAPAESPSTKTPLWSYAMPYTLGLVMMGFLLYEQLMTGRAETYLLIGTTVVLLLVIDRQTLAIQENRSLVERERRSLISSVSHELRTPLTAMIGFLTVLSDDGEQLAARDRQEMTDLVLGQAKGLGRMVTDIVTLSRDAPEQLNLERRETTGCDLAEAAITALGVPPSRIETDVEPAIVVELDPDRVGQILINLLTNATRYGGERILLVVRSDDSRALHLEVHDNGPGVPDQHRNEIWRRFERGQNQTNAERSGTGLGLAIVALIATAHGGTAAYRTSERLGGACFSIVLPNCVTAPQTQ